MPETTIEWTNYSFNPVLGCSKVSPECDFCYAERGSRRLASQRGLRLWDGDRYVTSPDYWLDPVRWNRTAGKLGVRRRVFCASYSDVFEDHATWTVVRPWLFYLIGVTPHLDWLLLSKRPENMRAMAPASWAHAWPSNVWAGTTCGLKASLGRLDHLRQVPAAIRFVSAEPLLELVAPNLSGIQWLIAGGESGPNARPFSLRWARLLRDRCRDERVAFFFKQAGNNAWDGPNRLRLIDKHGGDLSELPPDLGVREFPIGRAA